MGETILSHPEIIPIFPEMMAKLQAGLHRLDPTKLMHHLANSGVEINHMKPTRMLGSITAIADAAQAVDLIEINEWLTNNYPKQPEILAICHGDLHPNNILIHDGKVSGLIDWATTMFTHPEYDIAVTKTILSIGPPEDVGIPKAELDKMLGMALADYMAQCHELQDLDEALIDYYAVLRVGHAYAKVIGKRHGVDLPYVAHDGYAWDRPDLFAVVTRIIGETTGIDLVSA